MVASMRAFSACRRRPSSRSSAALAELRSKDLRCWSSCALRTWPSWRDRSWPPPWITELLSPLPEPPAIATFSGVLKNSEMPFKSPFDVEPSSHISRKKAIMAVTKSA